MAKKRDVVQVKNPKSGYYVKIDRSAGEIVSHKKSSGPYKNVPMAKKKKNKIEEPERENEPPKHLAAVAQ